MTNYDDDDKKITRAEAQARVKEGEELLFTACPCCQNLLAIYITHTVVANIPAKDLN